LAAARFSGISREETHPAEKNSWSPPQYFPENNSGRCRCPAIGAPAPTRAARRPRSRWDWPTHPDRRRPLAQQALTQSDSLTVCKLVMKLSHEDHGFRRGGPAPGQVRRRVCGFRLGQGNGSSRTRWFPWSPLFLNPHVAWYRKSNPVHSVAVPDLQEPSPENESAVSPAFAGDTAVLSGLRVPPRGVEVLQNPREIPQSRKIPDHIPDQLGWPPTSEIWFDSSRTSPRTSAGPS
jgi:hypothetical protein